LSLRAGNALLCARCINVGQIRDSHVPKFALGLGCRHAARDALRFADLGGAD